MPDNPSDPPVSEPVSASASAPVSEPASAPVSAAASEPADASAMLEVQDDGELELPYWLTSTEEAANTTFLQMMRRLPRLLRDAWMLGWRASRRTTAAVLILQLAAGVAAALGLISVVGVLDGLLAKSLVPRLGQPDDIAKLAAYLASDDASFATGADFRVDGGLVNH